MLLQVYRSLWGENLFPSQSLVGRKKVQDDFVIEVISQEFSECWLLVIDLSLI
jgi:hypothetical protein